MTPSAAHETLLVTGGAGFIGSNLVRFLLAETACRVVVLDKLGYAAGPEALADVAGARFRLVAGDVRDRRLVAELLAAERPRALLHLAAETHVDRSLDDPAPFIESNVLGSWCLLEEARRHLGRLSGREREAFRFVQVSTDEVYGSIAAGAAREDTPCAPSSPYAASKAAADQLALAWHTSYGLPVLVTRCSNNFGPFQFPEKLIPLMLLNASEGRPLPIYGDGRNERDWLYVRDHCEALLCALERGRPGEIYNVGGGESLANLALVERLCALLERERPARENPALRARGLSAYAELIRFVEDRPGHDRRYALDAGRARRELGWTPRHAFDAALAETVRWYLARPEWCALHDRRRLGRAAAEARP